MAQVIQFKAIQPDEPIATEPAEVARLLAAGQAVLIDVRETAEFEKQHIPGSLLMPLSFLDAQRFPRIPGVQIVLMCAIGKRSAAAGKQLIAAGHPTPLHLKGGLNAWREAGLAVED